MMDWFQQLNDRERLLVIVCSLAVSATLYFLLIMEPLAKREEQASNQHKAAIVQYQELQANALKAKTIRAQMAGQKPKVNSEQLLRLVDQGLKAAAISSELKSIAPEREGAVRLRFDNVSFDALIKWLVTFHNQHGIQVDSFSIVQAKDAGRVRASLLIN